jgi:hypothetical protein
MDKHTSRRTIVADVCAGSRTPAQKITLVIDETTAHLETPPELSEVFLAWFRGHGIACSVLPQKGHGGSGVIDFGDPSPAEERRIRTLLAGSGRDATG